MTIAVISYSLTGNNEALAASVAKTLGAEHIRISETQSRSTIRIMLDMMLNRTPKVQPLPTKLTHYDRILFIAPVWMGQAASPLRAYFQYLKAHPKTYAFASISGGGLNPNPKLADELRKRMGMDPAAFIDLHIADLLPPGQKVTMKATSSYRLSQAETAKLSDSIVQAVNKAWR